MKKGLSLQNGTLHITLIILWTHFMSYKTVVNKVKILGSFPTSVTPIACQLLVTPVFTMCSFACSIKKQPTCQKNPQNSRSLSGLFQSQAVYFI